MHSHSQPQQPGYCSPLVLQVATMFKCHHHDIVVSESHFWVTARCSFRPNIQ